MMLSSPSFLLRENAAEQLEHRHNDWSYSAPVVALDVVLNLVLVAVALCAVVLGGGVSEEDDREAEVIRVWVVGYGVGCMVHVACAAVEYRERLTGRGRSEDDSVEEDEGLRTSLLFDWSRLRGQRFVFASLGQHSEACRVRPTRCSHAFSGLLDLIGVCISFLTFDIMFVVPCITITCLIGIAVCCFLPCVIAILYAMADREGATQEQVEQLQKFKFQRILTKCEGFDGQVQSSSGGITTECDTHEADPFLRGCYGAELRQLPCGHYFHCGYIDKWLFISTICPLCKFNILKPPDREEV